ncbi:MAG: SpoIID/LytB domain-containing protein [Lachnospiraceae bacterium]|nr:SpoIID/LytB domain-containing protein [Lachnospiraceae bacterium]
MKRSSFHSAFPAGRTRRKKLRFVLLLAACMFLSLEIGWLTQKDRTAVSSEVEDDLVLSAELAGYLQIIPLSPEETRAWLLPSMDTYLTGSDVDYILSFLELDSFAESLRAQIPYEDGEQVTRQKWCLLYEMLYEYLGLSDEVKVISVRYLGMEPGESRIIADSGNYDCDAESIDFTYGETYEVYICGNTLLGQKTDTGESAAGSETADGGEGAAMAEPVIPETVRVLLTQDNHQNPVRDTVILKSETALRISDGNQEYTVNAGTSVNCTELMAQWDTRQLTAEAEENGRISISNAEGSAVSPYYRGKMNVYRNDSGAWIVNEPGLEEYLYGVVPGEMPANFAPEALKAQAVCARTYVCRKAAGGDYAEFMADVDDTTDCQVYLPSKENEAAIRAVDDTAGQVLVYQGYLAVVYYFSTSCGFTSDPGVWQSDAVDYLTCVSMLTVQSEIRDFDIFLRDTEISAYDSGSRYFRWTAELSPWIGQEAILKAAAEELAKNSQKISASDADGTPVTDPAGLGDYVNMTVVQRSESGTVTDLEIQFTGGSVHLYHENTIRTILGTVMTSLTDKNGDLVYTLNMLPSAAVSIDCLEDGTCRVYGGGLGHGIGLSQYGADGMAEDGKTCEEILEIFFPGTEISGVS